ncbi:hypothetical protein HWV62_14432 [Athelia sp. TMB]|nr:hypothetical protein HWV62_14432 [Athelia sp. TMB]
MPGQHDAYSPIGTGTHYVEYDLSSQLNLVTIPPTRHHSSDDSDPGSVSRGQGGSRASQAQVDPVLLRERSYSSRMGTSSEVPTYMGNANLSHHSAIRSTTSPFHDQRRERTRTPDSPDLRAPGQSQQPEAYDGTDFAHAPRDYQTYEDAAQPQHQDPALPQSQYYRLGEYQGVIAPEFETDETLRYANDYVNASNAAGPSSSTHAGRSSHIPPPAFPTAPGFDDAEQYLRHQLGLPRDRPVDLWALQDPPGREKPTQPLPNLVKLAIFGSPRKKLTLQEIYRSLIERFAWFKDHEEELSWKNSIRHNLSLNKVFQGQSRPITEPGKGNYWVLDLSKGEGYKRPRIRKTRAQQREINNKKAAQNQAASSGEDASSPQTPNSAGPSASGSGLQGSQGVEEGPGDPTPQQSHFPSAVSGRSKPRRVNSSSPYPLRQIPSPVHTSVSEVQLDPSLDPSLRTSSSSGSRPHMAQGDIPLDPMLMDQGGNMYNRQLQSHSNPMMSSYQQQQQQQPFTHSQHQPSFSHPSFGRPSFPTPSFGSPYNQSSAFSPASLSPQLGSGDMVFASEYSQASLVPPGAVAPPPRDRSDVILVNDGGLPRLQRVTPPPGHQPQQRQPNQFPYAGDHGGR